MKLFGYPISCWFEFHKWTQRKDEKEGYKYRYCKKCNIVEWIQPYPTYFPDRILVDKTDEMIWEDFDFK